MTPCGQVAWHLPQPVQASVSTTGRPSAPIESASNGQARTQLPNPRQPYLQAFGPPLTSFAAAQSATPS